MDNNFTITQICNEVQQLAHIGLCVEEDVLELWKVNKHRVNTWQKVQDAIREYYSDRCKPDRAFNEISNLKQSGTM